VSGSVDERIAACTRAIQNDPKDTTNLFYRALNYRYDKEDYDRAIADLSEAIRLAPGNSTYRQTRGEAFFQKREYDRAIADLSEPIGFNHKYDQSSPSRGLSSKARGKMERALAALRRPLDQNQDDSTAKKPRAETKKAGKAAKGPAAPATPAPPKKEAVAAP